MGVAPGSSTIIAPQKGAVALRADFLSGFLVFLIAMPLCLAIAKASNFPPICGIWTAVAGGLIATWISNSQLTIKGPAAGMIVIVAGSVVGFADYYDPKPENFAQMSPEEQTSLQEARLAKAYPLALGVGVVAGALQILFGVFRVGRLGDFFPLAAIHGLLASIGIIIISKSVATVLGVPSNLVQDLKPLQALAAIPMTMIPNLTQNIAIIGLGSLVILFTMPFIKNPYIRKIPSPILVLLYAVPMSMFLGIDSKYRVPMPSVLENPSSAFFFPDFGGIFTSVGIQYIILFSVIGSLESLLSAKAVDLLDPQKRKTNLDRDMLGIGVANTLVACIGGLPMISEIVRSSANINNGAQTRRANFFHGCFLLAFVLFLPMVIRMIPLAALSAMLVFTGFRLAHPMEFVKTYKVGKEQIVVFVTTIIMTLATDMLIGVLSGVVMKFLLHLLHGVNFRAAWKPRIEVEQASDTSARIVVHEAAVFTNWLLVKGKIDRFGPTSDVTLDLADVYMVDHSVMEKLHEMEQDFSRSGGHFHVTGLEEFKKLSNHPQAARKKPKSGTSSPDQQTPEVAQSS